jgi:hypothetical protein
MSQLAETLKDPEVRKEAEEAGASAFVEKSLDKKSIQTCIQELLPE